MMEINKNFVQNVQICRIWPILENNFGHHVVLLTLLEKTSTYFLTYMKRHGLRVGHNGIFFLPFFCFIKKVKHGFGPDRRKCIFFELCDLKKHMIYELYIYTENILQKIICLSDMVCRKSCTII